MTSPVTTTISRLRRWREFFHAKDGVSMLEFALVAPIFFFLLMGIIETGMIFYASSVLQYAADDAGRMVRTGQAQNSQWTATDLQNRICTDISAVLACGGSLQIDMETYPSFGTANFTNPLLANGTLNPALNNYQPGTSCSIVLLRVFYTWSITTPEMQIFLSNMAGNNRLLIGAAAFRNEPYQTSVAGC
jgi:Flp pilus assembly protein TadG